MAFGGGNTFARFWNISSCYWKVGVWNNPLRPDNSQKCVQNIKAQRFSSKIVPGVFSLVSQQLYNVQTYSENAQFQKYVPQMVF